MSAPRAPLRISTPIRLGVLALGLVFGYRTVERLLATRASGEPATVSAAAESTSRALADDVEQAEAQRLNHVCKSHTKVSAVSFSKNLDFPTRCKLRRSKRSS